MPRVSILMTTFNSGKFLSDAVQSVISQDLEDWELILIDNGSTDGSVLELDKRDDRFRIICLEQNIGRTPALALALDLSRSPFAAVLDADDVARPSRLSKQVEALKLDPSLVLVASRIEFLCDDDLRVVAGPNTSGIVSDDQLAERNIIAHSSVMFRTEAAREVGGYRPEYQYAQDYDLYIRLAKKGKMEVLDAPLTTLRRHSRSMTANRETQILRCIEEGHLALLAARTLDLSPRGVQLNRRRRALIELERAFLELKRFRFTKFLTVLCLAFKADPSMSWITYILKGRPLPRRFD